MVTREVTVWFHHSPPLPASKEKPMQHPYFQSFSSQPWHRNVCCSQPSASISAWCHGRQQVTKTHDLPQRQSTWDCQIQLQTGQPDIRVQLWYKQPSGGVLGEERVQGCLSSASKALNYNSSSIVKIGKNKPNPNLGSVPFNYHRFSKQHMAGQGGKGCMAFSFLKSFFSWNCFSPSVSNISNINSHYIAYSNYLNCLWKLFCRVSGKIFYLER